MSPSQFPQTDPRAVLTPPIAHRPAVIVGPHRSGLEGEYPFVLLNHKRRRFWSHREGGDDTLIHSPQIPIPPPMPPPLSGPIVCGFGILYVLCKGRVSTHINDCPPSIKGKSVEAGYNASFLEGCKARIEHNKTARVTYSRCSKNRHKFRRGPVGFRPIQQ